jgi:diguanylate cyclase (GGDEF)-like protein
LKAVARLLQGVSRSTDFVARYGGEEFAILLPETDQAGAVILAERFRRAIASARWLERSITVSIGTSYVTEGLPNEATLVRQADEALYQAKKEGRNRVCHFGHSKRIAAMATA